MHSTSLCVLTRSAATAILLAATASLTYAAGYGVTFQDKAATAEVYDFAFAYGPNNTTNQNDYAITSYSDTQSSDCNGTYNQIYEGIVWTSKANAEVHGSVSVGVTHLYAKATAELATPQNGTLLNPLRPEAYASVNVSWQDRITFTPTQDVPAGTWVDFTVTMYLDSSVQCTDSGYSLAMPNPISAYRPNQELGMASTSVIVNGYSDSVTNSGGSAMLTKTLNARAKAGTPFTISQYTSVDANVFATYDHPLESSVVDASNTSYLTISVTTPGIAYTSESQTIYDGTQVPEPTIAGLLLPMGFLITRRRQG